MENPKPLCYEVTYSGYGYFTDIICDYLPLLFAYKIMFHPRQAKIVCFIIHFIGCVLVTKILTQCRSCRKWTDMNWKWCLKVSIDWYWFYRVGTTIHATFISRKIFTLIVMTDIFFQYFFRRWSNKMLTKYGVMMIFSI